MSKESSIKVFAENASGTRPANAIPVWIDNISAIGGGGGGEGGNPEVESYVTTNSGKIDDVCSTVQTNSASWSSAPNDTFYIYPGKTTDKEISENSGKDMKLYNSANNVYLDFAGKSTFSNYAMLSFKEVTGTQGNQNTVQHLRLRVYPAATSACKVYDTTSVNLLDSNSTVSYASTATYDDNGNYLSQTHSELTALNQFIQSNSANWEGGSAPAGGEGVLFHFYNSYDPNYGSQSRSSWVSGATELYFETYIGSVQGTPSEVVITRNGSEIGRAYWNQVSSDGSYNFYTASYNNADGGEIGLQNNGPGYDCYVSANGAKTNAIQQDSYDCSIDKTVKFNIQGYNFHGMIEGWLQGGYTPLTSFTGALTDFTAKGFERYVAQISREDSDNSYSYDIYAEFGEGGSTVASGDVFPPTNNLDPYSTYYLGWNANNGGLFWYNPGNGGN